MESICSYTNQSVSLFSKLESMSGSWDDEINITSTMIENLRPMMVKLTANVPVVPFKPTRPSQANSDYDILIQVDAAATGGGAIVAVNGHIFEVQEGWKQHIRHSAWAEPIAATNMVKWAKKKYYEQHPSSSVPTIAVCSDHEAIAGRQRRPLTARGGFSPSYYLNAFFRELYGEDGRSNSHVFWVEGIKMGRADFLSRNVKIGDPLSYCEIKDRAFPSLLNSTTPSLTTRRTALGGTSNEGERSAS